MSNRYELLGVKALEPNRLTLTHNGVGSVNWNAMSSDFEVVFGEDRVCCIDSVLVEFLSPKIARLRRCDISFDVYTFKDSEMFDVFESLVLSLRSGEALRVEKSNFPALVRLSQELENEELLASLLGMLKTESLSLEEAILLLRCGIDLGTAFSDRFENLRDFVASHFYEIEKQLLDDLDLKTSQFLLSSPSLQLEDEDSLYDFVRSRSENDLSFASLFEFVHFDYLSVHSIEDFSSFVSYRCIENINLDIWGQICTRLILEAKPSGANPRVFIPPPIEYRETEFFYDVSKPLEGIFAHFTRECGGNIHDQGIVNITASDCPEDRCCPKNTVNGLGNANNQNNFGREFFCSENYPDSWICYDFKERRVLPTSYTVMSFWERPHAEHPQSWVIEVSNDATSWTEIDRRDNNDELNDYDAIANFEISGVSNESFRFFRFRQTGPNHYGNYYLTIARLEIFGTLFEP